MIYKVHVNNTGQNVLVYNATRDILRQYNGNAAKGITKEFGLQPMSKIYVSGSYDLTTDEIILGAKVPAEDW